MESQVIKPDHPWEGIEALESHYHGLCLYRDSETDLECLLTYEEHQEESE
jgi:hypothetical protein